MGNEASKQRIGIIIVGPSGSGKSTLWRALKKANEILNKNIVVHAMNPKSMSRKQLLGEMDPDTREWSDGVLTTFSRQVTKEPEGTHSWVVCDGDIDPVWIEALNSV